MSRPFQLYGHRGARGLAPENTLAGIRLALELGVDGLEIDVHLPMASSGSSTIRT